MKLNKEEIELLSYIYDLNMRKSNLLRIFMSSSEIKIANKLVKLGLLWKGMNDAKGGTTAYFITRDGEKFLEDNDYR